MPFYNAIPKECQDHNLLEKFEVEKNAIVIKALTAYLQLRDNHYIFSGEELLSIEKMTVNNEEDTVVSFVQNCCEYVGLDEGTFTKQLFEAYQEFCKSEMLSPLCSIEKFSAALKVTCGDKIKASKWRDKRP